MKPEKKNKTIFKTKSSQQFLDHKKKLYLRFPFSFFFLWGGDVLNIYTRLNFHPINLPKTQINRRKHIRVFIESGATIVQRESGEEYVLGKQRSLKVVSE